MSTNLNEYDKEAQGKLWHNDKKETDNQPDFTGSIVLEGVKHSIAAWNNVTKAGTKYFGLRISEWMDKESDKAPIPMTVNEVKEMVNDSNKEEVTDDLPF